MRRVYGYKRRDHAGGKRYQDGQDAQARGDAPIVIETQTLGTAVAEAGEEIDLKVGAGVVVAPAASTGKSVDDSVDSEDQVEKGSPVQAEAEAADPENDTGELPGHLTGFMPTEAMQPAAGDLPATPDDKIDPDAE